MGQATCTIMDLDGSLEQITLIQDTGDGQTVYDTYDPTPSGVECTRTRAIVKHPIPTLDRDIGQDMGAYSNEYPLSGLCRLSTRDKMNAMFQATQFTTTSPGGRFKVRLVKDDGVTVLFEKQGLAIRSFSYRALPGSPDWFRWSLIFVEFYGQT